MKFKESVRYFRSSTDVGLSYQNQKYDLLRLFASAQIRWFVNITTDSWGGRRWEKFNCCHPYIMTAVNNYIFIGSFRSIIIAYFWLESCAWNVIRSVFLQQTMPLSRLRSINRIIKKYITDLGFMPLHNWELLFFTICLISKRKRFLSFIKFKVLSVKLLNYHESTVR